MKKIRTLKIDSEKIRGLEILGFSEKNTPDGYSPLKMTTPLVQLMTRACVRECTSTCACVRGWRV